MCMVDQIEVEKQAKEILRNIISYRKGTVKMRAKVHKYFLNLFVHTHIYDI